MARISGILMGVALVLLACVIGAYGQPSASVAASGNAQASASTNGQQISVTGQPGCGATQTLGNAYAYASGAPITDVVVQWGLGQTYVPLTLCTGSTITFQWNTGTTSQVYGLYQIESAVCPASFAGQKLLITPAPSPSATSKTTINLTAAGSYYFADPNYCAQGLLQSVTVS